MLSIEEKKQALQWAANGATFMFIPEDRLVNMVVVDSLEARGISKAVKLAILSKDPIRMETTTIVEYCMGVLDRKNSWVLDHGDLKVVPARFETKKKENKDE